MITTEKLKETVRIYIISRSFPANSELDDNTLIFDEGILDSIGFMSLTAFLESTYNIKFDDLDLLETNFESINAITEFISMKLSK